MLRLLAYRFKHHKYHYALLCADCSRNPPHGDQINLTAPISPQWIAESRIGECGGCGAKGLVDNPTEAESCSHN